MIPFYSNYYDSSRTFHGSIPRAMGTRFDILIPQSTKDNAQSVWLKIIAELDRLDTVINRFNSNSELSTVNRLGTTANTTVSDELWQILIDCKKYNERTYGMFDISLKNFSCLHFNDARQSVSFSIDNIFLDLGAYGKGYALEKISALLQERSIENAFVNFGNSSVLAIGRHPYGDNWSIQVENPFSKGQTFHTFKLKDQAISTSGNALNHTNHIINPVTGEMNNEKKIVCVVTKSGIDAEVLSTSFMIADKETGDAIRKNFTIDHLMIFDNLNNDK